MLLENLWMKDKKFQLMLRSDQFTEMLQNLKNKQQRLKFLKQELKLLICLFHLLKVEKLVCLEEPELVRQLLFKS